MAYFDTIDLVSNDNLPVVTLTLTNSATGAPLDLSPPTVTVVVYFRALGTTTVLATLACSKATTGADGVVQFSFPGTTLAIAAGLYEGEIEISWGGLKQTVYDLLKFRVRENFN